MEFILHIINPCMESWSLYSTLLIPVWGRGVISTLLIPVRDRRVISTLLIPVRGIEVYTPHY